MRVQYAKISSTVSAAAGQGIALDSDVHLCHSGDVVVVAVSLVVVVLAIGGTKSNEQEVAPPTSFCSATSPLRLLVRDQSGLGTWF